MSEVILIKDYSDTVKKSFGTSVNQGRFMREVFKASGYDRFPSASDEDYAKKICNGSKPITDDMISGFPRPYRIEDLADYFFKHIDDKKVPTLAAAFKINDKTIDMNCLCKALAAQFFGLVEVGGADHEADDIVGSSYRKLMDGADSQLSWLHHIIRVIGLGWQMVRNPGTMKRGSMKSSSTSGSYEMTAR